MHHRYTYYFIVIALVFVAACSGSGPSTAPTPVAEVVPSTNASASASGASASDSGSNAPDGDLTGSKTFVIIPAESRALYIVGEEFFGGALEKYGIPSGIQDTVGTTQAIQGQLNLNFDDLSSPVEDNYFEVDLSTLTSDQSLRDGWIRDNGPSFGQYPIATFVANSVTGAPTSYTEGEEVEFALTGDMTIREITQPVTFTVRASLQDNRLQGVATSSMLLTDFGIDPPSFANTLTVKDEFTIQVEFLAQAQ
jgi:polyisoprenoid-binding protein YceI